MAFAKALQSPMVGKNCPSLKSCSISANAGVPTEALPPGTSGEPWNCERPIRKFEIDRPEMNKTGLKMVQGARSPSFDCLVASGILGFRGRAAVGAVH